MRVLNLLVPLRVLNLLVPVIVLNLRVNMRYIQGVYIDIMSLCTSTYIHIWGNFCTTKISRILRLIAGL